MTCPSDDTLLLLQLGELSVNETAALNEHCARCTRCRALRAEHALLLQDLAAAPAQADSADAFTARVLAACQAVREEPARPAKRWWIVSASALAVAAAVALVQLRGTAELTARGASQARRAVFAELLFVRERIFYPAASAQLRTGDGLAVRCSNRTDQATHLAVFARDAAGDVHWIYPRYLDEQDDPSSIRVSAGVHDQLLDEVVEPDRPAEGAFHIFALMGERPLHVKDVEARLAAHPGRHPRELWPDLRTQEWSATWTR